jgi:DNA-binding transcriptional MerR regulator
VVEQRGAPARSFDVSELADLAGVTTRTIHYYIQQGLLPAAARTGPGPKYHSGHLARLMLIKRLQRSHLPLAAIARRLKALSDDDVQRLADATASPASKPSTALEYVQSVLGGGRPATRDADGVQTGTRLGRAAPPGPVKRDSVATVDALSGPAAERSQWDRITLTDGLELHVRRPADRLRQKAVDRLLASAREILGEEPL